MFPKIIMDAQFLIFSFQITFLSRFSAFFASRFLSKVYGKSLTDNKYVHYMTQLLDKSCHCYDMCHSLNVSDVEIYCT